MEPDFLKHVIGDYTGCGHLVSTDLKGSSEVSFKTPMGQGLRTNKSLYSPLKLPPPHRCSPLMTSCPLVICITLQSMPTCTARDYQVMGMMSSLRAASRASPVLLLGFRHENRMGSSSHCFQWESAP